jgi:hypothetical protein
MPDSRSNTLKASVVPGQCGKYAATRRHLAAKSQVKTRMRAPL